MEEFEEFFDETLEILKIMTTTKSVRKTTVMKLQKAGVSNDNIIAIMGTKEKKASSTILILTYKNKEISAEKFLELHIMKSSPNCRKLFFNFFKRRRNKHGRLL